MKSSKILIVATVTVIAIGLICFLLLRKSFVGADDISSGRITVLGGLGHPIGTLVTIRCELVDSKPLDDLSKKRGGHLKISEVNHVPLRPAYLYPLELVTYVMDGREKSVPKVVGKFECYAYENMSYYGSPFDSLNGVVVGGDSSSFGTILRICNIENVKDVSTMAK